MVTWLPSLYHQAEAFQEVLLEGFCEHVGSLDLRLAILDSYCAISYILAKVVEFGGHVFSSWSHFVGRG